MKNLRGSVLTVMMTIVVGGSGSWTAGQQLPPTLPGGSAVPGVQPQNGIIGPPASSGGAYVPQLPMQAGQIPTLGIQASAPYAHPQTPLPVAHIGAPQFAQPAYPVPAMPVAYPGMMPMQAPMGMQFPGVQPASYGSPQPFPGSPGMPMQAGYEAGYGGGGGDYGGGCPNCGGHGCEYCGGYGSAGGYFSRLLDNLLPYGEGGPCAPRWYDISLDAMYLKRDRASRRVDFSSDGIVVGPPTPADILLSTDDLDFDEELGFRFTGVRQLWAGATIEFGYFGLFNWAASAVNRPPTFQDDIFSVLSNFGNAPFNGFDETDRARQHTIAYSSTLDNFELNIRKRFTMPNCRIQVSWLAGVRYVYLLEDFNYLTLGGDFDPITPGLQSRGNMDYGVTTRNSLTGFQLGGDIWANVVPGINVGADIKAGVYGNYANQTTGITATTTLPANTQTIDESVDGNDIAMIAEANVNFIYRMGPHWTLRAGYTMLYLEGVALAPENFNSTPPNILTTGGAFTFVPRAASVNDNGDAFYHGAYAGLEWMW
ncbi:MAG: hypothetical protein CMJ64_21380 [Planctomycetaceae bacterium]|nr:hypothetical protein [Planctomycetaceae bacterium]